MFSLLKVFYAIESTSMISRVLKAPSDFARNLYVSRTFTFTVYYAIKSMVL